MLAKLGDSVTTDHISPAGAIKADSPAGRYLTEHGVERRDFNSYGSRRGNHEVMIRGTFANIRLRNQLVPGVEGGATRNLLTGEQTTIYDASVAYAEAGVPLVVLAGKEYGSGSSRDWAAKGTALLGVRAVLAESYERIHRSNLIGMGVLPLQYADGRDRRVARADRRGDLRRGRCRGDERRRRAADGDRPGGRARVPGGPADRHPRRGGLLPPRRHHAVRAAPAAPMTSWGAVAAERAVPLPCDGLLPDADVVLHRAVDVAAPAAVTFRWLCQLRVAPYSYDLLDNRGRRSPRALTPGLDRLEVGQRMMTIFTLADFTAGEQLTVRLTDRVGRRLFGRVVITYAVAPRADRRRPGCWCGCGSPGWTRSGGGHSPGATW